MGKADTCSSKQGEHQTLKLGEVGGSLGPLSPCKDRVEEGRRVHSREHWSAGGQGCVCGTGLGGRFAVHSGEVTSVFAALLGPFPGSLIFFFFFFCPGDSSFSSPSQ